MSRSILYLHGFGNSADMATLQIGGLQQALDATIHRLNGFHALDEEQVKLGAGIPQEVKELWPDFPLFSWYSIRRVEAPEGSTDRPVNWPVSFGAVEAARDRIVDHIVKSGGYDGVVGFSQGASMAMLVAERVSEINALVARKLKFVGCFACANSIFICRGGEPPNAAPAYSAPGTMVGLRAFFCAGSDDPFSGPDKISALEESFRVAGADVAACMWEGVHRMPPPGHQAYQSMCDHVSSDPPPTTRTTTAAATADLPPGRSLEPDGGDDDDLSFFGF
jgi:hypothetical protein